VVPSGEAMRLITASGWVKVFVKKGLFAGMTGSITLDGDETWHTLM